MSRGELEISARYLIQFALECLADVVEEYEDKSDYLTSILEMRKTE
ncbi:MAG: hypothetical protein ACR2PX_00685 [Endozoicomonas sp.]